MAYFKEVDGIPMMERKIPVVTKIQVTIPITGQAYTAVVDKNKANSCMMLPYIDPTAGGRRKTLRVVNLDTGLLELGPVTTMFPGFFVVLADVSGDKPRFELKHGNYALVDLDHTAYDPEVA